MPRNGEASSQAEASATAPTRLPEHMRRQLEGLDYGGDALAVEAFVTQGTIPSTDEGCQEVAEWCIEQGLAEHFACIPVTTMLLSLGETTSETLEQCLSNARHLRKLTIVADIRPEDSDLTMPQAIALALRTPSLERLELTGVQNDDLKPLCSALEENRTLKELKLVGDRFSNRLCFDDGSALAEVLQHHPSLASLSLQRCKSSAADPILRLLHGKGARLERLEMRRLVFGTPAARAQWYQAIASMLSVNRSLAALWIDGNGLDHGDLEVLGIALRNNVSLQELCMGVAQAGYEIVEGRPARVVVEHSETRHALSDAVDGFIQSVKQNFGLVALKIHSILTREQDEVIQAHLLLTRTRRFKCSMGFMQGAGMGFAQSVMSSVGQDSDIGRIIGEHVARTSTAEELRAAGGPALPRVNRASSQAAVTERSRQFKNELLRLLKAGEHERLAALWRDLRPVTILPSHMDELMKQAAEMDQLPALLEAMDKAS